MISVGPLGPVNPCCGAYPGHRLPCWTFNPSRLPWAGRWPWSPRCQAVREASRDREERTLSGVLRDALLQRRRCELEPHPEFIDHALRRDGETWRWSTRWTA